MTRARFILVSVLAAFGSVVGLNRERLAKRWLEANGFEIIERFTERYDDDGYFAYWTHAIGLRGVVGGWRHIRTPAKLDEPCWTYLSRYLAKDDFKVVELHREIVVTGDIDWTDTAWNDLKITYRELAPPTIHRFERPWFV
jgi:hypothetical protein